jgi:hypothetical protein
VVRLVGRGVGWGEGGERIKEECTREEEREEEEKERDRGNEKEQQSYVPFPSFPFFSLPNPQGHILVAAAVVDEWVCSHMVALG